MPTTRTAPATIEQIVDQPWALQQSTLAQLVELMGHRADTGALAAFSRPPAPTQRAGSVAVIPVFGMISQRASILSDLFGGTSIDDLRASFRQAMADPRVKAVILHVDSPGGAVSGVTEFAAEIRAARGVKRVAAVVEPLAASAAYWLAAQAEEIVVTPSGSVGSIGIYAVHREVSKALEAEGIKTTLVSAGPHKTEGNEWEPLTDEARAHMQERVDAFYAQFLGDVAKGRRTTVERVAATYGGGRVLLAKPALAAGMVDSINTLDETRRRLERTPEPAVGVRAEGDPPELASADPDDPRPFRERVDALATEAEAVLEHATTRARLRAKEDRPAFSDITAASLRSIRDAFSALLATDDPAPSPTPAVQPPPIVAPAVMAATHRFRSPEDWAAFLREM